MENRPVPLLKPPVWTWEVPTYFFVGGAAGVAAALAFVVSVTRGEPHIEQAARWVAMAGAVLSPLLLISDLGRPTRFLYMLRVFKWQSAMSVGAWTLVAFSGAVFTGFTIDQLAPATSTLGTAAGVAADLGAALLGLILATYTGVLIGATAVPIWARNRRVLPLHFGASSLGAAVSVVELLAGFGPALNTAGLLAAAIETALGLRHEWRRRADPADDVMLLRVSPLFSGLVPLVLRSLAATSPLARTVAATAAVLGSLLTRFAWLAAGRYSVARVHEKVDPTP